MTRFVVSDTPIAGVKLVQRQPLEDERGLFTRVFCVQDLAHAGWSKPLAQINQTLTRHRGTVRGLHYQQAPHADMKLVSCLRGEVWDVVVDLRAGSATFLHWHARHLSADNHSALLVPEGCAHGFQSLSDDAELLYCHSAPYVARADVGLHPLDERLNIQWPLPVAMLSERDARHPMVDARFKGALT